MFSFKNKLKEKKIVILKDIFWKHICLQRFGKWRLNKTKQKARKALNPIYCTLVVSIPGPFIAEGSPSSHTLSIVIRDQLHISCYVIL